MEVFLASRAAVLDWIGDLGQQYEVYFPQPTGDVSFQFTRVTEESSLALEPFDSPQPRVEFRASSNVNPPVKRLSPAREQLFTFQRNAAGEIEFTPTLVDGFQVLAGVRPCDLKAIHLMDRVNSEGAADPYYLTRRAQTAIIAHDCLQPCDEHCFCDSAGSLRFRQGADIFLTPLESELLIESFTEQGDDLLRQAGFNRCENPEPLKQQAEAQRANPFGRQLQAPLEQIAQSLADGWDSAIWQKHVERCFSCGTCNLVCPTCYCFDVHDDFDLQDTSAGERYRTWDSCMLDDFDEVAGGHNFRAEPAARQRHRVKRKFEYLFKQYAEGSFCVGCGRCGHQCTVDIDIFDIVNDMLRERSE